MRYNINERMRFGQSCGFHELRRLSRYLCYQLSRILHILHVSGYYIYIYIYIHTQLQTIKSFIPCALWSKINFISFFFLCVCVDYISQIMTYIIVLLSSLYQDLAAGACVRSGVVI